MENVLVGGVSVLPVDVLDPDARTTLFEARECPVLCESSMLVLSAPADDNRCPINKVSSRPSRFPPALAVCPQG